MLVATVSLALLAADAWLWTLIDLFGDNHSEDIEEIFENLEKIDQRLENVGN